MALALELTGSPLAVGGILTLRLLPAAVGGPLATACRQALGPSANDAGDGRAARGGHRLGAVHPGDLVGVHVRVRPRGREPRVPARARRVDPRPRRRGGPARRERARARVVVRRRSRSAPPRSRRSPRCRSPISSGARSRWCSGSTPATFLVSFAFISRLTMLAGDDGDDATPDDVRFFDAFRIPLVRAVMPAAAAVALGLGALFSLGHRVRPRGARRLRHRVRRAHRVVRRRCGVRAARAAAASRARPA